MRLYKKNKNRLCKIIWKDARTDLTVTLREMIRKGFSINTTVGRQRYFDREKVIISTEWSEESDYEDLTLIPVGWIIGVEVLE